MVVISHPSEDWQIILTYNEQGQLAKVHAGHAPETSKAVRWAQEEVYGYCRNEDTGPLLTDFRPKFLEDLMEFLYDEFGIEEETALRWSDFAKWPLRPAPEPELTIIQQGNLIAQLQDRLRQANEQLDWDGLGKF